ncbi:MAG: DUF1501 domain-containing protein [Acidobacteriota bacterium]|nr:DUF1501 domain-containing protein [Acidobacteriota bacterium]
MKRRQFLQTTAVGLSALVFSRAPIRAASTAGRKQPTLVVIFQRGAMDGLAAVQPLDDDNLKRLRPRLAMSRKGRQGETLLQLDGRFGLHPAMAPLAPLFAQKKLAIIHGAGLPIAVRSHFDAQDMMETATPGVKSTPTGWLNRLLAQGLGNGGPFNALALSPDLPRAFHGPQKVLAMEDLRDLARTGARGGPVEAFQALYGEAAEELLAKTGRESLEASRILANLDLEPPGGIDYPSGAPATGLNQVARLIHADRDVSLALIPSGGWDTHINQGAQRGAFSRAAGNFARSIDAFWRDLGKKHQKNVLVLTMTEFGRTVAENGTNGTDHGRGSCFFVLGRKVRGGKVYGEVPKLTEKNLEDGRDLPVTTDFREVLAGAVRDHLKIDYDETLFPNWQGRPLSYLRRS